MNNQGKLQLTQLDLVNFDGSYTKTLLDQYTVLNLTHSLFENCMSGSVDIADAISLREDLPIIGEETLKIKFRTGDIEFSKDFRVYKYSDGEQITNSAGSAFRLYFVSPELFINETKIVKKLYKNKLVSQIVKELFDQLDSSSKFTIEPTIGIQKMVVSSKKPIQAINLLTTYAIPSDSLGSMFTFYETPAGFFFKNIEKLYDGEIKQSFKVNVFQLGDTLQEEFIEVQDFKIINGFDYLKGVSDGMYSNRVYSFDPLTRTYKKKEYNYGKNFGDTKHIEMGSPFKSPSAKTPDSFYEKFVTTKSSRQGSSYIRQNDSDSTFKKGIEEILPHRISMMRQLQTQFVSATVTGNSNIEAGDIVEFVFPVNSYSRKQDDDVNDPDYSGRWLVTSVTHSFNLDEFLTILTCSKDVFKQVPKLRIK